MQASGFARHRRGISGTWPGTCARAACQRPARRSGRRWPSLPSRSSRRSARSARPALRHSIAACLLSGSSSSPSDAPGDFGDQVSEPGGYVAQLGLRANADLDAEHAPAKQDAEAMFGDRRQDPAPDREASWPRWQMSAAQPALQVPRMVCCQTGSRCGRIRATEWTVTGNQGLRNRSSGLLPAIMGRSVGRKHPGSQRLPCGAGPSKREPANFFPAFLPAGMPSFSKNLVMAFTRYSAYN